MTASASASWMYCMIGPVVLVVVPAVRVDLVRRVLGVGVGRHGVLTRGSGRRG